MNASKLEAEDESVMLVDTEHTVSDEPKCQVSWQNLVGGTGLEPVTSSV